MRCKLIWIYGILFLIVISGLLFARHFWRPGLPGGLSRTFYYGNGWSYVAVMKSSVRELTCDGGYILGFVDISKPVSSGQIKLFLDGSRWTDAALITNGSYRLSVSKGRHVVNGYAFRLPFEKLPFDVRLNYATNNIVINDTADAVARMPTFVLEVLP